MEWNIATIVITTIIMPITINGDNRTYSSLVLGQDFVSMTA